MRARLPRLLAAVLVLPLLLAAAAPGRDGLDGLAPEVVDGDVLGEVDKHVPVILDKVGGVAGEVPAIVDKEVPVILEKEVPAILDRFDGAGIEAPVSLEEANGGKTAETAGDADTGAAGETDKEAPGGAARTDVSAGLDVLAGLGEQRTAAVADDLVKDAPYSPENTTRGVLDVVATDGIPVIEGGATNELAAIKGALIRDTHMGVPGQDKLEDAVTQGQRSALEDTTGDVPFILDTGEPLETPQEPSEALTRARKTLQKTLDQVLHEAEEHARATGQDMGEEEYYDDDGGEVQGPETTPEQAINKTRAELQRTLEQMLTEAQYEALLEAMAEEGEDLAEPLQNTTTSAPAGMAATATEDPRDDAAAENQQTSTTSSKEGEASSSETAMSSTEIPTTTETPTSSTEVPTSAETSTSSTEVPTSTETSTSSTEVPTSTETSTSSMETPSSTETQTSTTETSTSSTETPSWAMEENLFQHLVVPLGGEDAADSAGGTAADTSGAEAPEHVIEAAVAAAAVVQAAASCPTKQPAPLRLPALPNAAPESDNPQCARDSRLLDLHVRNHTLWAVQMQDAGAGGITGLLEGNVYHLGDFDECMDVMGPVRAQYCVAEVRVHPPPRTPDYRHHPDARPDPMQSVWNHIKHEGEAWRLPLDTLHVAVCAPASCGTRDLQDAIQIALNDHADCANLPVAYTVTVLDVLCTSPAKQSPPFSTGEVIYIVVVAFLVLAVFVGTAIDLYVTDKKSGVRWLLVLFSLRRSWRMLFKADPKPMGLDLDPLSGARAVNMIVLVIAHRGFNLLRGPVHNYNQYETIPRALLHTGATHAQLFVDTCFVMSGLLVALLELTKAHAHGKDNDARSTLLPALVHRYVRLTPSYAMVVFFYATVFWRFGSGPLWDQVIGHESAACAKYWWTNMFYVNNYIDSDKLCMFQSWYMPCDLHLFFIGYVLIGVVTSHRRTGLAFLLAFLAASMLVPFFVTFWGSKPALLEMLPNLFRAPDQSDNFRTMYAPTHIRAAPYMVGLLVGYLFQRLALRSKERFTQGVTWLLCLGGVFLTTASLLSSVVFYDPDLSYNGIAAGLYAALCPVVWSAGVCLVLASLVLGSRTFMSAVLAWKPLVVLSRLTYNVYLVHWAFQIASVAKARTPFHLDVYNLFYLAFGDLVTSFLVSLALFLLVEAPFRSLSRKITDTPPESIVHIRAAQERNNSALEAGFTGAIPKSNS